MKQNFKAKGKNAPQKPAKGSSLKPSRTVRIPDDKKLKVIGHQLKPCVILTESSLNLKEEELLMDEDEMLELEAETLETAAEDGESLFTENVLKEIQSRLQAHELIKVKLRFNDREDRQEVLNAVIAETGARLIQSIGKVALIFKASDKFSLKTSNIEQFSHFIG